MSVLVFARGDDWNLWPCMFSPNKLIKCPEKKTNKSVQIYQNLLNFRIFLKSPKTVHRITRTSHGKSDPNRTQHVSQWFNPPRMGKNSFPSLSHETHYERGISDEEISAFYSTFSLLSTGWRLSCFRILGLGSSYSSETLWENRLLSLMIKKRLLEPTETRYTHSQCVRDKKRGEEKEIVWKEGLRHHHHRRCRFYNMLE